MSAMDPAIPSHRPPGTVPVATDAARSESRYRNPAEWIISGIVGIAGSGLILLEIAHPGSVLGLLLCLFGSLFAVGILAPELAVLLALCGLLRGGNTPPPQALVPNADELARRKDAALGGFLAGLLLGWWLGGPPGNSDG